MGEGQTEIGQISLAYAGTDRMTYEYKVVPAPTRGQKGKGVKGADGRFAHAIETHLNVLAAEGWEFFKAETLPHEERSGLTRTTTTYRTLLIYRRAQPSAAPESTTPLTEPTAEPHEERSETTAPETTPPEEQTAETPEPARDAEEVVRAGVKSLQQDE